MTSSVVVTGADGFIGRVLVGQLRQAGRHVVPVTRAVLASQVDSTSSGDFAAFSAWPALLANADAVVHLAARAHVLHDSAADPLAESRRVNVGGTERLLTAAVRQGVRRFVFVSSIGVLGNDSGAQAFTASDRARPAEPYAQSKWEAEQRVAQVAAGSMTQYVIVRPPLVYGPGAKGNFRRLLRLVYSGMPLPFAGLEARRSFIGVENLAGLLSTCLDHPAAAGRTFLAADGEDVTLPGLLDAIGRGLDRPARLFRAPWGLAEGLATLMGRGKDFARLTGSLRVDDSVTRELLGWRPSVRFEAGIRAMAESYLEEAFLA
jgi:nucleoside-diphosphate-sugar epimerase